MRHDDVTARVDFAREVVHEAGRLALAMQADRKGLEIGAKGARDFVTEADKAVEVLIADRLGRHFGDVILGEEFGGAADVPALWIVDPIDGTYNYMHANPRWCVSLALVVGGRPELGFIHAPQSDTFYEARRGSGATRNGRRLTVSDGRFQAAPLVEVGCSPRQPLGDYLGLIERLMTAGIETRRYGSGALGVAQVASGEVDGYVEAHINAWDIAAGVLMVTEAGGVTSNFFAGGGIRDGNPILVAAPWLADRLASLSGIAIDPDARLRQEAHRQVAATPHTPPPARRR